MKNHITRLMVFLCLLAGFARASERAFFAFDNGLRDVVSLEDKAALLAELGYAGIGWRPGKTAEMLAALDKHGLKMFATYVSLPPKGRAVPVPEDVTREIEVLKGRDTMVWLNILDPHKQLDDAVVLECIRKVADVAQGAGLRVVLYPHVGCYTDTTPNCLRLAKLAGCKNLGVSFNLCHFLRHNTSDKLEAELAEAAPLLELVSINGTDEGPSEPILPLDQGNFDIGRLLRALDKIGYQGPVGLQCFEVGKPARVHLASSMDAWREFHATR